MGNFCFLYAFFHTPGGRAGRGGRPCTRSSMGNSHVRRRWRIPGQIFLEQHLEQNISRSMNPWVGWTVCKVSCTVESGVDARRLVVANRRGGSSGLPVLGCVDSCRLPTHERAENQAKQGINDTKSRLTTGKNGLRLRSLQPSSTNDARTSEPCMACRVQARPVCPVPIARRRGARRALL